VVRDIAKKCDGLRGEQKGRDAALIQPVDEEPHGDAADDGHDGRDGDGEPG
jgi:hypothetical protein